MIYDIDKPKLVILLLIVGWIITIPSIVLTSRLIWESTILSWENGPQMVGFALAHGHFFGIPLLFAFFFGLIWLPITIVIIIRYKRFKDKALLLVIFTYIGCWGINSIPYGYWQFLFSEKIATSQHASRFINLQAAKGEFYNVKGLLERGVSLEGKNSYGQTPLHSASINGHIEIVEYLIQRGADVNSTNLKGDSILYSAYSRKMMNVVIILEKNGAIKIVGTEE